jgi:pre-mRNA-splicing factor 38A
MHIDEIVDQLLREERFCDIALPRIPKRWLLEELGTLEEGGR